MDRSLTVVLPVPGSQGSLNTTVQDLLDVLPDLTGRFEVLIVDDGSKEMLSEAAHGLARDYPQVRVVGRGDLPNREAAIRMGLEQSTGDVVFLREDSAAANRVQEIPRLWKAIDEEKAGSTGGGPTDRPNGYRIVCRHGGPMKKPLEVSAPTAAPREASAQSKPARPNYLARLRKFTLDE